jgi:hypothetical protein
VAFNAPQALKEFIEQNPIRPGRGSVTGRAVLDHTDGWLLREGWWADAFPAPSYRELVSWSMRALPWAIVTNIGGRYWLSSSLHWKRRIPARTWLIGELAVALLISPALLVLLGLSLLLGLLPIPYVRQLVLAVQSRLTATAGDSLAFVESPIRAALIRACILDGLVRLKQLCKHTVIIAHSQGAAVVLDVLGGFLEPGEEPQPEATSRPLPDALVTFGAGTNQLASQKVVAAGLPEELRGTNNPASRAVLAIFTIALAILTFPVFTGGEELDVQAVLMSLVALFLCLTPILLTITLVNKLIKDEQRRNRILAGKCVQLFSMVLEALFLSYAAYFNPVALLWVFPLTAVLLFAALANSILSPGIEKVLAAPVRRPPGLARWDDLYASADPVPNGPMRPTGVSDTSVKIWNLGSLFADHTAYWNNRDGFVLRVARVCAETAQSPWVRELPGESESVDKRAAWRVGFLQIAQWSARLGWLVLLVVLWVWHQSSIPVPSMVPDWVPRGAPVQFALLVTFIALAMWATSVVIRWPWNWWVRREQEAVLAHDFPQGNEEVPLTYMGMIVEIVFFLVIFAWFAQAPINLSLSTFGSMLFLWSVSFVWVMYLTVVLLKLKPPPAAPGSSDHGTGAL